MLTGLRVTRCGGRGLFHAHQIQRGSKCQTNSIAGPFWPVPLLFPFSQFRRPVLHETPATASEPDPVFATVTAHRVAFVEHMRAARLDGKFQVVSEGTRIESEHSKGGTPRAQDKEPEGTKTIRRLPSCIRSE